MRVDKTKMNHLGSLDISTRITRFFIANWSRYNQPIYMNVYSKATDSKTMEKLYAK